MHEIRSDNLIQILELFMKTKKSDDKKNKKNESLFSESANPELYIVGIGASAGGLEALRAVLPNLPTRSIMAYVIVQHMDPKHRSMLTSLLTRDTELPVTQISDGQSVEPNHVYITPSGKDVTLKNGQLILSEPARAIGPKPSIDQFFTSLAHDKHEKAVGIILSGTGSDGAHGMRAIKAEGGITIVQREATAKYNGMPRAAIETGVIDLILPPEDIGKELLEIFSYPAGKPRVQADAAPVDTLENIFQLLLEKTDCDFSGYKLSTIHRRIDRRIAVHKLNDLNEYLNLLKHSATETQLLFKDILISVTSFFRDPEAYRNLRDELGKMIENKQPGDEIRIWIPGCATGEEAYSIALLLAEQLGERLNNYNVQIFGTDIDLDAISSARRGIYPAAVLGEIDKKYLDEYFTQEDNSYQVVKKIREMIIFARQNLTKDPPFSRLDLVSCRNVLIYFTSSLQEKIIPLFHYVLNVNGYLLLGKSESIGHFDNLFIATQKKSKIFRRRETPSKPVLNFGNSLWPTFSKKVAYKKTGEKDVRLRDLMNQTIADVFGHPGLLIDDRLEVVHIQGDVSRYLTLPSGDTTLNILTMARSEFRLDLRALIHKAIREQLPVRSKRIRLKDNSESKLVTLNIRPLDKSSAYAQFILVLFEEEEVVPEEGVNSNTSFYDKNIDPRIAEMEHELTATREHLHTTVQELETANEELQSLNEELQSANEELQSSNEELETANEELQSTNEELTTVNEELQVKSAECAQANTDLENILHRVGIAMIIVDKTLQITRFTQEAMCLFELTRQDIGRVLTTIACKASLPDLRNQLMNIIGNEKLVQKHVEADKRTFLMKLLPYYSEHKKSSGVLLIFIDETDNQRKEIEHQANNPE